MSGTINSAYGSRCYNSPLGESLFAAGRLGQKTGAGYYKYVKGKPVADPTLVPLIEAARSQAKDKAAVDAAKLGDDELVEATLFPGTFALRAHTLLPTPPRRIECVLLRARAACWAVSARG